MRKQPSKSSIDSKVVADTAGTTGKQVRKAKTPPLANEYLKYFVAPQSTPRTFEILDLSDGASVSYSLHT